MTTTNSNCKNGIFNTFLIFIFVITVILLFVFTKDSFKEINHKIDSLEIQNKILDSIIYEKEH